ncbi:MAG: tRNA dihydrouridine synthase DusB [Verrucomicrobia bacterium]|nr:tRNA dihydrouridine synthase DusB [Verrucomicrobiota bacterium]
MSLRIGTLQLESNLALAPLAGYADLPFRRIVRELGGLGLATTELVSARGLLKGTGRSHEIAATGAGDRPLAVQLYGVEAEYMARAAQWAAANGADVIDINMGCPVKKVMRHGAGAAILKKPDDALAVAKRIVEAVTVPVTVKMRLGYSPNEFVARELAPRLRDAGVAAITIHGRYATQKYTGEVDLDGIRAVVEATVGVPVYGNGDVRTPDDAVRMLEATGCAGVSIGRGALADPWIFRDTHALLTTGRLPEPPSEQERADLIWRHFLATVEARGERCACLQFRKWLARYARKLRRLKDHRTMVTTLSSADELKAVLAPSE